MPTVRASRGASSTSFPNSGEGVCSELLTIPASAKNYFVESSGIHNASFGVNGVCLDGIPHVNWLRTMEMSTQNGRHIGLRYPLPNHGPGIKVGAFAHGLTCLVIAQ